MEKKYVIAIDQSTSGTKAMVFDATGKIIARADKAHAQHISEEGYVSHNAEEIWENTLFVVGAAIKKAEIPLGQIAALGISNQRETALVWERETGRPIGEAVVWQCARAQPQCARLQNKADQVLQKTGLRLSPYFSAAKIAWIMENCPPQGKRALCAGNMDSFLIFNLTGGKEFRTDYSNAARTQLFNLQTLQWDSELCDWFGIDPAVLPKITDSNGLFGYTDFQGLLPSPIPIHAVLGDSNGALFGQGCHRPGMAKATYGTGSSVMLHIGETPVYSDLGVVTSVAWGMGGKVSYVLEGNINYTGAVTKWLVDQVGLIENSKEAGFLAAEADPEDTCYLVPAFTGLGAPHWNSEVRAILCGMSRSTGRKEIARAAEDCIAYQITDVIELMGKACGRPLVELRVDGGPTGDPYLMQFQSDILQIPVAVPGMEELSGIGAAYAAGLSIGVFTESVFDTLSRTIFVPTMKSEVRTQKYQGWKQAVSMLLDQKI